MRNFLTVASLLAVSLAGCSAVDASDAAADAPEWAPGHEWSYSWERETTMESELERRDDWRSSDDDTTFRVVANATPFQEEPGWLVHRDGDRVSSFFFPWTELMFLREADMRPERGDQFIDSYCRPDDGCQVAYSNHAAPGDGGRSGPFIDFPIHTGKTWSHEIHDDRYDARVLGQSVVNVDAGRFQTIHIQYVMSDADDPAAKWEEQGATVHHYEADLEVVLDVHYAPDVEWVVLYELEARTAFDIDVTWPDGERYTDSGTATMQESIGLTGYALREEEPLDAEALANLLDLDVTAPGPYGMPQVVESNVTVTIDVSAPEVNIAEGDVVVLSASAEGDAAGYNHTWFVEQQDRYAYPTFLPSGEDGIDGDKIEYVAEDVGHYRVMVLTYDDQDRLVDLQEVGFQAIYAISEDAECDANVLGVTPAYCGAVDFPVNERGLRLKVTASFDGDRFIDNPSLVVLDASGRETARKELVRDEVTIEIEMYSWEGTWTTYVEPPTGSGGEVHYDVRLEPAGSIVRYYH